MTAQLKQELEKTGRADPAAVQKILARYQSREPGLQLPRFVATRKALEAWLDELQQPKLAELPALARAAKQNYQPIAKSDVARATNRRRNAPSAAWTIFSTAPAITVPNGVHTWT